MLIQARGLKQIGYLPYGKSASAGPFGYTASASILKRATLFTTAPGTIAAWGRFPAGRSDRDSGREQSVCLHRHDPLNQTDPSGNVLRASVQSSVCCGLLSRRE